MVEDTTNLACFATDATGLWFVLHTKSRQEKIVADNLAQFDIPHFLPLISEVRYYGNRKCAVEEPMFPGYVFLRGTLEQAYQIDRTRRIANILRVADQGGLNWELANLAVAMQRRAVLQPYPYLKSGIRAEVRAGPFRGLQGVIEGRTGLTRLILQVRMLGQGVCIEIDGALLEPLETNSLNPPQSKRAAG